MLDLTDLLLREFNEENFNCWHLCQEVAARMGKNLIGFNQWIERFDQRDAAIRSFEDDFIKLDNPEAGAIAVFSRNHKIINHIGIVLDKERFIHIGRRIKTPKIERLDDPTFVRALYGFYKYAERSKNQKSV